MARIKLSLLFAGIMLAIILTPDFLRAGPVGHPEKEEVAEFAEEKLASSLVLKKLTRNKRNAVAYYKRLPEFWAWYKYTHNQEGIESLDQLYVIFLQNKHRLEGDNFYKHYLTHLSEVYKACAKSDDPDCIPEYTSKPTAKVVMPAALRQSPVKVCNPYLDPYCTFSVGPQATPEELPPAPVSFKSPSPVMLPTPIQTPSGYHYYASALEPFLSREQQAGLLQICSPSDVECLQYHLRASHGYRPALTPVPSYAYLGCEPSKDPYCRPKIIASTPSGLYHVYPDCSPTVDPYCVSNIAPASQSAVEAPKGQYCNPLFEKGCNPLTVIRLVTLKTPVPQYVPQGVLTPLHLAALMNQYPISQKVKSSASSATAECHLYDPNCSNFSPPAGIEAAKNIQDALSYPILTAILKLTTIAVCAVRNPKTRKTQLRKDFLRGYLGHYKK